MAINEATLEYAYSASRLIYPFTVSAECYSMKSAIFPLFFTILIFFIFILLHHN